jgi:hypothetical protein
MRPSRESFQSAGEMHIGHTPWHGETPNLSDHVRAIPNLEFYAPWFREPVTPGITKADHRKLSPHAQHLTRFLVADSADELRTGYTLTPPR